MIIFLTRLLRAEPQNRLPRPRPQHCKKLHRVLRRLRQRQQPRIRRPGSDRATARRVKNFQVERAGISLKIPATVREFFNKGIFAAAVFGALCNFAAAQETAPESAEVLISIADQRLAVVRDGGLVKKYRISTSKFGTGDAMRSYKTPLGRLRVCDKIGGDLDPGTVIKHRQATSEIIPVNAPGRDPIVTRVLWLDGLDDCNRNARTRGIYIHGTPEESNIGRPVSWGCIRMRSRDVIELFDELPPGTLVDIIPDRLPRLHKYEPPKEAIIAENTAASEPARAPAEATEKPAARKKIAVYSHSNPPEEKKIIPADPGAAEALKGSILFANLGGLEAASPNTAPATK